MGQLGGLWKLCALWQFGVLASWLAFARGPENVREVFSGEGPATFLGCDSDPESKSPP